MEQKTRREKAYSLVKSIFKAEEQIRLAVIEAKTAERKGFTGGSGQAYKSDPTADKATRLLCDVPFIKLGEWTIRRPEDWLRVISQTYANTGKIERGIMRRYFDGEKISQIAVPGCGYALRTIYAIRDEFLSLAVEVACQYGLIKVVT